MSIDELKNHLNAISGIASNNKWKDALDERKVKEMEFHDLRKDREVIESLESDTYQEVYANKKYYSTVSRSKVYLDQWIATNCKGKVCLDYACGNGSLAIKAAQAGATLSIGLDISSVSIENAQRDANQLGLKNTFFFQADAENTNLPDGCVDIIICSGMLHHLDLSYAFPELRRILAPGGRILAGEALNYNPFIKLYRRLTPDMRTEWEKEHILSLKDIEFARHFFDIGEVRFWHVTSYLGAYVPRLLPVLNRIDDVLVRIPGFKLMAWIFTFELLAKEDII